jgi:ribonuclease HI
MRLARRSAYISIYSDGACIGNPGPGGYGVVILDGLNRRELSAGFRFTTSNRMELLGAINGLTDIKESSEITLYSDSKYLVDAMRLGWARKWERNGWHLAGGGGVANIDLWKRLLALARRHKVDFRWVKGHAGNVENERCDQLAFAAASRYDLAIDDGYKIPSVA